MKRSGSILIEVVISITLFLIGIIALASSLSMSLKSIVNSRQSIGTDMYLNNLAEKDLLCLAISPDYDDLTGSVATNKSSLANLTLVKQSGDDSSMGNITVDYTLYRYKSDDVKMKTVFYLLRRK